MVTIREWYERVNAEWPAVVPALDAKAAVNATRRLYRFATGRKLGWRVEVTSGNRHTWGRGGVLKVNPSKGWREFVHDFSHWLDRVAFWIDGKGDGRRPHARQHAQLERRLVREVVRRGWLAPKPAAAAPAVAPVPKPDANASKLAHASKMLAKAERRLKLATTLAKKWRRRVAIYSRKVTK